MLKRLLLVVVLLAGCEGAEKVEPAAATPQTPGAPAAASEDTAKWAAAHATVESLQKELELTEVAITTYRNVLENKGSLTTEATTKEAHERLPRLEKEQSELEARLAAAGAPIRSAVAASRSVRSARRTHWRWAAASTPAGGGLPVRARRLRRAGGSSRSRSRPGRRSPRPPPRQARRTRRRRRPPRR